MKTDFYTKCILTVIAIALVWQCLQSAASPRVVLAQQQSVEQRVVISGYVDPISRQVIGLSRYGVPVAVAAPLDDQPGSFAAVRVAEKARPK